MFMLALTRLATAGFALNVEFRNNGYLVATLCTEDQSRGGAVNLMPVIPLVEGVAMLHGNGERNLIGCLDIAGRQVLKKALAVGLVK